MKTYESIKEEINKAIESVKNQTEKDYKNWLEAVDKIDKLLHEFLFNFDKWDYDLDDNNPFFLALNQFKQSVLNICVVKNFIIKGFYNEAASILRNMFETMLFLEDIAQTPSSWPEWLEYQRFSEEVMKDKKIWDDKSYKQLRGKYSPISLINWDDNYWWTYSYLCLFSHVTMEKIRYSTSFTPEGYFYISYIPKYHDNKCKHYLYYLYIIIKISLDKFLKLIKFKQEPPPLLEFKRNLPNFDKLFILE